MTDVGCVLTFRGDAVLAVSRPRPPLRFGLPGGGVDPGETPIQAAARELHEETGYRAPVLEPVYRRRNGSRLIHVFFAPLVHGELRSSPEGIAAWVEPEVVAFGAFPGFAQRMFRGLGVPLRAC